MFDKIIADAIGPKNAPVVRNKALRMGIVVIMESHDLNINKKVDLIQELFIKAGWKKPIGYHNVDEFYME